MKPENTEHLRRERRGAAIGVLLFALLQTACVMGFAALCLIPGLPGWLSALFTALAVFCAALMLPALGALKKTLLRA